MAVDPQSPGDGVGDTIYYGTLGQARSTDAGASFVGIDRTSRRHPLMGIRAAARSPLRRLLRQ